MLGFSKSGTAALSLILRNPHVFNAAAAWDAPAQFSDMRAFHNSMKENFGSEENFDRYEIPRLLVKHAKAFGDRNRIWISGDDSAWTEHMIQLHNQMVQAGVRHTWVRSGRRTHSWYSGRLEGAVALLSANAPFDASIKTNTREIISYGSKRQSRFVF